MFIEAHETVITFVWMLMKGLHEYMHVLMCQSLTDKDVIL